MLHYFIASIKSEPLLSSAGFFKSKALLYSFVSVDTNKKHQISASSIDKYGLTTKLEPGTPVVAAQLQLKIYSFVKEKFKKIKTMIIFKELYKCLPMDHLTISSFKSLLLES
jgi:hypothetical protein